MDRKSPNEVAQEMALRYSNLMICNEREWYVFDNDNSLWSECHENFKLRDIIYEACKKEFNVRPTHNFVNTTLRLCETVM